jgi:hypothetical protein
MTFPLKAYFHLAQEVVHVLTPSPGIDATNLEEGIATEFGVSYLHQYFAGEPWDTWVGGRYLAARQAARDLLNVAPDAVLRLRNLGNGTKRLSEVTANEILATAPRWPVQTAHFLSQTF